EMTNRLKKETGDDFLQYMIGNIHYMKKDYNAAKINYKYIMENYEDFHSSYFSYMVCLAKSKKYKETVAVLNKLSTFDYSKFELIDYVETSEVGIENEFED
ncbi:MAG: tetratricopeptide repeat protein, partial [Flavobacteriales bacterium]